MVSTRQDALRFLRAILGLIAILLPLLILLALANVWFDLGIWRDFDYPTIAGEDNSDGDFILQAGIGTLIAVFLYMLLGTATDKD